MANNDTKTPKDNSKGVVKEAAKPAVKSVPKNAPKNAPKKKEDTVTLKERWEAIKNYFISVWNELKKVHWPDRKALVAYTGVVLLAVAIVSGLIWLFDSIVGNLLELLFKAFA